MRSARPPTARACGPCALYMLIGKLARYVVMTYALLFVFPGGIPGFGA